MSPKSRDLLSAIKLSAKCQTQTLLMGVLAEVHPFLACIGGQGTDP